jgi:hypothetical protein
MLVTLDLSNGQEKKRKKKKASKRLVYPNTLSHTYPQNLHHTYLYKKTDILSIVYVPCICIQKNHTYFLLCNSKLMEK